MKRLIATILASFLATPLWAAETISDCAGPTSVHSVVEPWSEATRTFANGKIRIVWLDTGGEPACCSSHLAIMAPSASDEEPEFRECKVLNDGHEWTGFQSIDLKGVRSSYNASKGLLLKVPVERYVDGIKSKKVTIGIRINQVTGSIVIE